jgi:hypothetical protein
LAFSFLVGCGHRHNAFADSRHLGPSIEVDDCGYDVAAESGANLEKQVIMSLAISCFVVAYLQVGAVGGQACFCCAGDSWCEVSASRRRAIYDNLGFIFVDEVVNYSGVAIGLIAAQKRVLGEVNLVCAELNKLFSERFDVVARQNRSEGDFQDVGEVPSFTHKLDRGIFELAFMLFCEYPNFAISIYVNHIFVARYS